MQNLLDITFRIPAQAALGKNVRLLARPGFKRPGNDLFGMPQPINRSSIDPVDAQFQRPVNGRYRIIVVLRSPRELPATAADSPRSIPNRGDVQIGLAKLPGFHFNLLDRSQDSKSIARGSNGMNI